MQVSANHHLTAGTPIIVDTTGAGFSLTSAQDGVSFDMEGKGQAVQLSWTALGSDNAFLALDRDGNGTIDSGKELFGNFTDQPKSDDPNGFLALSVFDKPENGGNGDGVIDERDRIWSSLRLWIDVNHDGISQPEELSTLPDLGVYSISLRYTQSRRRDEYGNLFRYKGTVNPAGQPKSDSVAKHIYDVIFMLEDETAYFPKKLLSTVRF